MERTNGSDGAAGGYPLDLRSPERRRHIEAVVDIETSCAAMEAEILKPAPPMPANRRWQVNVSGRSKLKDHVRSKPRKIVHLDGSQRGSRALLIASGLIPS
jgi:hypothetical protein